MRLALTGKPKALHFTSTVSVGMGQPGVVTEEQVRSLCTPIERNGLVSLNSAAWQLGADLMAERRSMGGYAAGYGASKWACEV
jgi:thioester reductase-like protein